MIMEKDKLTQEEILENKHLLQAEVKNVLNSVYYSVLKNNVYKKIKESDLLNHTELDLINEAITVWGAFNQIKWERDIAISQLEELGLSLGETVDHIKELIEANGKGE